MTQQEKPPRRRCKARNRRGGQCKRYPIPGGTVCKMHGGAAPQVKRKAALRLQELVDPALKVLAREMVSAEKSSDRLRAVENVLDRAGITRKQDQVDETSAQEMLIAKLQQMTGQ